MEKGHFGHYSGNARHSHTPVTKRNYRASVADDAAHIHYLKEDINYDAKHGHSDENMTADEKHISKLAGDMKYDKKHHGSPAKQIDERFGEGVDEFGTPIPTGFSADAPDFVGGRVLSDINTSRGNTFSIGDEERDFRPVPYQAGGGTAYALPVGVSYDRRQRGLPTSARNMQTRTTDGGMAIYSREDMQNVINAVQAQNAPINEARRNLNAANYTQAEIDLYNQQQENIGSNARFRRGPNQRDKNPRSITGKG